MDPRAPEEEIRILITEGQPTNRLLLKKILSKAGLTLPEAKNDRKAIEKWSEWNPHLILIDKNFPVKKGSDNDPIIVSLAAYALEQARLLDMEAGCSDFVAKPFRPHEHFSVISKHLGISYVFKEAT